MAWPPTRDINPTAERALQAIRSLARVYVDRDGSMPAELDPRYAWAIKTIFNVANDALSKAPGAVVPMERPHAR